MTHPYPILDRKRAGEELDQEEIAQAVGGAVDGSWSDAQLGAFLMACATRGMTVAETQALTAAMLDSGDRWDLAEELPGVVDKHSTGGVGDKVSLILSPLLASCGVPVVMLTGRGLGHTGGTADKLECIPGLNLELSRERCLQLLESLGMAIGVATANIAPADRKLYALRDQTGTVVSIPLVTASILSKKLATGAAALVFDVKTGSGAFFPRPEEARELARSLVATAAAMGQKTAAVVTDMSQPLGNWVGHRAEVVETLHCLAGAGPPDLMEVVYLLSEQVAALSGRELSRTELEAAVQSGAARSSFDSWVEAQGGDRHWLDHQITLAPEQVPVRASRSGYLSAVDTRRIGLLLTAAGGGRLSADAEIDDGVALHYLARLGQRLEAGDEIARLFLRRRNDELERGFGECFTLRDEAADPPPLLYERVPG